MTENYRMLHDDQINTVRVWQCENHIISNMTFQMFIVSE